MSVVLPFTATHVSSLTARAAELEQLGEDHGDPDVLVRSARLYRLAVRVADDINGRLAPPFTSADLARVRDELRSLAARTAASEPPEDAASEQRRSADATGDLTRAFRELAVRIEQRVAADDPLVRQPDMEPRA